MPVETPDDSVAEAAPCWPASQAILPIIEFIDDHVALHYDERGAVEILKENPAAELYDTCGAPVKLADDGQHLERCGDEENAGAIRERILDSLTACAQNKLEGKYASELCEVIEWLREAPSLRSLVAGLDGAPRVYALSYRCQTCHGSMWNTPQSPPCCPG